MYKIILYITREPPHRSSRANAKRVLLTYPDDEGQSTKYAQTIKMSFIQELLSALVPDQLPIDKHINHPQHYKLFHSPVKLDVSPHIGAALRSTSCNA